MFWVLTIVVVGIFGALGWFVAKSDADAPLSDRARFIAGGALVVVVVGLVVYALLG